MGSFNFNGIDSLEMSLAQLAQLSDDEKWSILSAGAEVIRAAHETALKTAFQVITGALSASISVKRKTKDGGVIAQIQPTGKHPGTGTGRRMKKEHGTRRSSGSYAGSNAEIAYYLEYGTPRIAARHWMETANEEAAEEMFAAEQAAWDEHLRSLNL